MIYGDMVLGPSIGKLIELEHLVYVQYYAPSKPDLKGLKVRMGDYSESELANRMDKVQLVGDIVENFARICPDRQTVVFATGVRHSIHIKERFLDAGILAEHIDGTTPKNERDEILKKLATREIQVVSNCMVLTEGWDCPPVSCCILARPTKSLGLYIQMAGRILRPYDGKDNAIIIDHSGAVFEHGFIDEPRDWSLDPGEKIQERENRSKKNKKEPITCEECKAVYTGRPDCPKCGHTPVKKGEVFEVVEAELGRLERDGRYKEHQFTKHQKERFYRELKFIQLKRGYQSGWVANKYKERFGEWPARGLNEEPISPGHETLSWVRKENIRYAREQKKR